MLADYFLVQVFKVTATADFLFSIFISDSPAHSFPLVVNANEEENGMLLIYPQSIFIKLYK